MPIIDYHCHLPPGAKWPISASVIAAAKDLIKRIKDAGLKVQASIQGEKLRVTGKKRDDLQATIAFLRGAELPLALQFDNFRD